MVQFGQLFQLKKYITLYYFQHFMIDPIYQVFCSTVNKVNVIIIKMPINISLLQVQVTLLLSYCTWCYWDLATDKEKVVTYISAVSVLFAVLLWKLH